MINRLISVGLAALCVTLWVLVLRGLALILFVGIAWSFLCGWVCAYVPDRLWKKSLSPRAQDAVLCCLGMIGALVATVACLGVEWRLGMVAPSFAVATHRQLMMLIMETSAREMAARLHNLRQTPEGRFARFLENFINPADLSRWRWYRRVQGGVWVQLYTNEMPGGVDWWQPESMERPPFPHRVTDREDYRSPAERVDRATDDGVSYTISYSMLDDSAGWSGNVSAVASTAGPDGQPACAWSNAMRVNVFGTGDPEGDRDEAVRVLVSKIALFSNAKVTRIVGPSGDMHVTPLSAPGSRDLS